jgi:hypothetical protein
MLLAQALVGVATAAGLQSRLHGFESRHSLASSLARWLTNVRLYADATGVSRFEDGDFRSHSRERGHGVESSCWVD